MFSFRGRILRALTPDGLADYDALAASPAAARLVAEGRLIDADRLTPAAMEALGREIVWDPPAGGTAAVLEHPPVAFPSYAFEWPPEMLAAAARLTLDLAETLLPEGLGLKDATPYNVLFRGGRAVFIDVSSVERRDPAAATWLPYAQFVRTFLLPLLAWREFGLAPHAVLATRRDGLEPEELYRMAGPLQRLRPPMLGLVTMPRLLGARERLPAAGGATSGHRRAEAQEDATRAAGRAAGRGESTGPAAERARFILGRLLRGLGRTLDRLRPPADATSAWSGYAEANSYSDAAGATKRDLVADALEALGPKRVLDVGCNTGDFALLAAEAGAAVVAIDTDPVVVGRVWRRAAATGADVLPLVVDLARPTPALGWRNQETRAFLDRARGHFDAVLLLAVVHHLLVTERVPLEEIVGLVAELTRAAAIVEFVPPADPMFRRIARGRDHLFEGLDLAGFEAAWRKRFHVRSVRPVGDSGRHLLMLEKRGEAAG